MSKRIFRTLAGSRLYGVHTEDSDYDYKGVFLEDLDELLLKADNVNVFKVSDGVEEEHFSLNYYMKLLGQGQVIPVDMLFAPSKFWTHSSKEWEVIYSERKRYVSANVVPFVGYAKGQAMKYGAKGNKIKTIEKAIALVQSRVPFDQLCDELEDMEGVEFHTEAAAGGPLPHIIICGKSFGKTTRYDLWEQPLQKLRSTFGTRAELASHGLDLKAQYHTVRICSEAVELLTTGELTFPRPEADTLIKIRSGEFTASQLEELVETQFNLVKKAEASTTLPKQPDLDRMKQVVYLLQASHLQDSL